MTRFADLPSYGDLMTWEEFQDMALGHSFMDDDGSGYLVASPPGFEDTLLMDRDQPVDCQAICEGRFVVPEGYTHVIWFNK